LVVGLNSGMADRSMALVGSVESSSANARRATTNPRARTRQPAVLVCARPSRKPILPGGSLGLGLSFFGLLGLLALYLGVFGGIP
jgi:hypothetical protein